MRRRSDVTGLADALDWRDWMPAGDGRWVDTGNRFRRDAVAALGSIDSAEARDGIGRALEDPDEVVRIAAIEVLSEHRDRVPIVAAAAATWPPGTHDRAYDAAIGAMETDPVSGARAYVASLSRSRRAPTQRDGQTVRSLVEAAAWPAEAWREIIEALLDSAAGSESEGFAEDPLDWAGPHAYPALSDALAQPRRRAAAAAGLGLLRDARALHPLTEHIGDPHTAVRREVARALGRLRHPAALRPLLVASQDEAFDVRDAALSALDTFGVVAVAASIVAAGQTTGDLSMSLGAPSDEGTPLGLWPAQGDASGARAPLLRRLLSWRR